MIEFTQYLRPHGHRRYTQIDRGPDIEQKAEEIRKLGFYFEIEELTNGMVSMSVMKRGYEGTVSIRLCQNGPEVPANVDELIADAYSKKDLEFDDEKENY